MSCDKSGLAKAVSPESSRRVSFQKPLFRDVEAASSTNMLGGLFVLALDGFFIPHEGFSHQLKLILMKGTFPFGQVAAWSLLMR